MKKNLMMSSMALIVLYVGAYLNMLGEISFGMLIAMSIPYLIVSIYNVAKGNFLRNAEVNRNFVVYGIFLATFTVASLIYTIFALYMEAWDQIMFFSGVQLILLILQKYEINRAMLEGSLA